MAKLALKTLFTSDEIQKETALDKTTRIVRRMNNDDAEKRHLKVARLRSARFQKEAGESAEASVTESAMGGNHRSQTLATSASSDCIPKGLIMTKGKNNKKETKTPKQEKPKVHATANSQGEKPVVSISGKKLK